jgi:hypothetical protein
MEQVIASKSEEMNRLRGYYSEIIEKLEEEWQAKQNELKA